MHPIIRLLSLYGAFSLVESFGATTGAFDLLKVATSLFPGNSNSANHLNSELARDNPKAFTFMGHRELLGVHLLANYIPRISSDQLDENSKPSNLFLSSEDQNQFEENAKETNKKKTFSRAGVGQQKIHQRVQLHVGANSHYFFDGRPNEGNNTEYEENDTESRQSISQDYFSDGLSNASFFLISILVLSS
jgi:hypothetical protein